MEIIHLNIISNIKLYIRLFEKGMHFSIKHDKIKKSNDQQSRLFEF